MTGEQKDKLLKDNLTYFLECLGNGEYHDLHETPAYSYLQGRFQIFPSGLVYNVNGDKSIELITFLKLLGGHQFPINIWVEDAEEKIEVLNQLNQEGFRQIHCFAGMYLPATGLQGDGTVGVKNFQIRPVETDEELHEWARVITERWWEAGRTETSNLFQVYQQFLNKDVFHFYVGYANDKAVATAMSVVNGDAAGLYLITTDPDYRNRGIGKAITRRAVEDAVDRGCQHIVLQATGEGKVIYNKLGFEERFNYLVHQV